MSSNASAGGNGLVRKRGKRGDSKNVNDSAHSKERNMMNLTNIQLCHLMHLLELCVIEQHSTSFTVIIEPPMTKKEEQYREEIMDIFIRSLTANIDEIDANPGYYLRTAMDGITKSYGMKINKKSKSKIFYYLKRDRLAMVRWMSS